MIEIRELTDPPQLLGEAATLAAAMDRLDAECRQRYDQAAAGGQGGGRRHRFELVEDGDTAAVLSWAPDLTRPYEQATAAMRSHSEMP